MLATTHIAFTEILARLLGLHGSTYFLAHLFGWGVDIDHLLFHLKDFRKNFSDYLNRKKHTRFWRKYMPHSIIIFLDRHIKQLSSYKVPRSFIQEPFGIALTLVLSVFIRNYVPVVFLFMHFLLDSIMKFNKYPLAPFTKRLKYSGFFKTNTQKEYILSGFLLLILIIWRMFTGF